MVTTVVTTRHADGVGWIRLSGPDRLNAIASSTCEAVGRAITAFEGNDEVGAVVIHGDGKVFSAGADIEEVQSFSQREQFAAFLTGLSRVFDLIAESPLPTIAAVHGVALGGGFELALACDLRVVTRDSKLGLPEAKLGVLPGAGGTQRLPRTIPVGVATEMLMTGTAISGERAYDLGLANRVVEPDDLLDTASQLAAELVSAAPGVVAGTKSLVRLALSTPLSDGLIIERDVVSDLFDAPAGRAGFAQFRKRSS